jgi:hypothetical protein
MRCFASAVVALPLCALTCAETPTAMVSSTKGAPSPCKDAKSWQENLRTLQSSPVLAVEAHYTRNTCDGTTQVIGTRVLLRGPDDSSRAALSWMLQCRASRVFIGEAGWLPDGWLDIEVKPEGGNVVVALSADSVPKNIQLFHRTAEFVRAH